MKNYALYLLVVVAIAMTFSCSKKKDKNATPQPHVTRADTLFPLRPGNEWHYKNLRDQHIIVYGELNEFNYDTTNLVITVTKDTIIDYRHYFVVREVASHRNQPDITRYAYYSIREDGLYMVGSSDNQTYSDNFSFRKDEEQTMWNNARGLFHLPAQHNGNRANMDIVFFDNPVKLLKFPLVQNEKWNASPDYPYTDEVRSYTKDTTLSVPAGTFNCLQLTKMLDYDSNNQPDEGTYVTFEYFGNKGLALWKYSYTESTTDHWLLNHEYMRLESVNF